MLCFRSSKSSRLAPEPPPAPEFPQQNKMSAAGDEDASSSPTASCLRLLCSFGGRILPRPSDGQLKYVGGETRVIVVPRSISFQEMKGRIEGTFKAEVVVKYQLMSEDLDALVSVTCDDDLAHMRDEYDRYESKRSPSSSPRFRLFLFAIPKPSSSSSLPPSPRHLTVGADRRYADAINEPSSSNFGRPIFPASSSSDANSPTSASGRLGLGGGMHRVWSTPNLGGSASNQIAAHSNGSQYLQHHQHQHQQKQGHYGHYWRVGGPGRYDMCGCGCRGPGAMPPRTAGYYYTPAGAGGCGCCGHVEEHAPQPLRRSASPFAARQRKPTIWE